MPRGQRSPTIGQGESTTQQQGDGFATPRCGLPKFARRSYQAGFRTTGVDTRPRVSAPLASTSVRTLQSHRDPPSSFRPDRPPSGSRYRTDPCQEAPSGVSNLRSVFQRRPIRAFVHLVASTPVWGLRIVFRRHPSGRRT